MSWRTSESLVLAASLALAGCNQLEAIETGGGGGGGGGIPPAVRAAFEESCGKVGCHAPGGVAPVLAGAELNGILTGASNGVPYVTLGDTANSYIAIVMLPESVLSALGLTRTVPRMPADQDFLNPNNQIILSWIAGAEFEGGADPTTGDPTTDTDTGDTDTTTGEPVEPTFANVQALLDKYCSLCHGLPAGAGNGNFSMTMGDSYGDIVGVKSPSTDLNLIEPNKPEESYLYLKLAGGFEEVGGVGTLMPPATGLADQAQIDLVKEWILAGAPND
jgi:hypothetical protein